MAASDTTSVAYIYKRMYSDRAVGDIARRNHPTMTILRDKRSDDIGGTGHFYAIRYGNPQGVSASFSNAQTNASGSNGVQMQASRVVKYGVITLDGVSILAARSNKAAFLDLVTQETDGVIEEHGDHLSFELFRDGTGARGRRSSETSDVTTLTVADDARNFKVDMTVIASPNADGSSPRTGSTPITSVDEDAGTIGLDTSAITSYSDNDYLFVEGDADTALEGFMAHLPLTAPSSGESFRGVDRSVDPRRLAGVRINDTATPIEENAGKVAVRIGQVGQQGRIVVLNPLKFHDMVLRLNAKVEYDGGGNKAAHGFESVAIHSAAGTLRAISDPDCPTNRGFVLDPSTWYVPRLGGALVHIIRDDGRPNLRRTSEDGIEARTRSVANPCCIKPGSNGVFAI